MSAVVDPAPGTAAAVRVAPGRPARRWSVTVPGSKSLTNRALLAAAVAGGTSRLAHTLVADDTIVMRNALSAIGVEITEVGAELSVGGLGGPPTGPARVYCAMAGTVGRFLLPVLSAGHGRFEVDAHAQLARRPLGPVLAALRAQGATIIGEAFPLELEAAGLSGGELSVDASVSSQFLSGLMLAAPLARAPTTLRFARAVSAPYLGLTAAVMGAFGAEVTLDRGSVRIRPGGLTAAQYEVEPDASTASYFLAAAALTGTEVTVARLHRSRTGQGDVVVAEHLTRMGATLEDGPAGLVLAGPGPGPGPGLGPGLGAGGRALAGVHVEMSDASDVFMTLACVAPFAGSPTTIEGLANVRVKESDRLAATAENLRRLGIEVEEGNDRLTIHPGVPRAGVRLPTYSDHRIAMAFALIGTRVPVEIEDPHVVEKTCPSFWELWRATGAEITPC